MYDIFFLKEDDNVEIKKIEKLKSGKYKIHFEGKDPLITYDSVILHQNLLYHKRISLEEYKILEKETEHYRILDEIIKQINKKYRSEKEIKDFLEKNGVQQKEEILSYLRENHFLDDDRFTRAYVNDRSLLSNDGPLLIKSNLLKEGISEDKIMSVLDEIPSEVWENKIKKLILKKMSTNYSPTIQKQKILLDLTQKGFSKEEVFACLENQTFSSAGILKEYEKIKRKLEKKYSGNNLEYEIKKKLYQKGYTSSDIEKYLS